MSEQPASSSRRRYLLLGIILGGAGFFLLALVFLCGAMTLGTASQNTFNNVGTGLKSGAVPDPKEIEHPD